MRSVRSSALAIPGLKTMKQIMNHGFYMVISYKQIRSATIYVIGLFLMIYKIKKFKMVPNIYSNVKSTTSLSEVKTSRYHSR